MNVTRDVKAPPHGDAEQTYSSDMVLDVRAIFWGFFKYSWIIVIFAAYGFYQGYKEARAFEPQYVASMVVLPQAQGGGLSVSGGAGGGGGGATGLAAGLSAVLGVGGGSQGTGAFDRLKLLMGSQDLARRLDERYGMLRGVFASRWDAEKQDWKPRVVAEPTWRQRFLASLHQGGSIEPGYEALSRYVKGVLQFEPVEGTGFWRVKVYHTEKARALELLTQIYQTADDLLRAQDREKTRRKLQYLEQRMQETSITELRQALLAALIKEEHSAHMLEGDLPYGADIVDPPFVSDLKTSPVLIKTIGVPFVGSAAVGFFVVLLFAVFRAEYVGRKRQA